MEKNVRNFLTKTSRCIGNFHSETFDLNSYYYMKENNITSPIEQLFYIAFEAIRITNNFNDLDPMEDENGGYFLGIGLYEQFNIGKYKVDFLASYFPSRDQNKFVNVVIECDSQSFHDRSEKERRYEKQRDRFIQKYGYKVFRFTGSEIVNNPFDSAVEVISYLTKIPINDLMCQVVEYGE